MVVRKSRNKVNTADILPVLSKHDRIFLVLPKPRWLRNESLLDNVWKISTHEGMVRNDEHDINFNVPVRPYDNLLNYEDDIITAKLLAYYGLEGASARYSTASSVPNAVRNYVMFVRWRLEKGIHHNSELTADWIHLLLDEMAEKGIVGLIDYDPILTKLELAVGRGDIELPFYQRGRSRYVRNEFLARAMGVSHYKLLPKRVLSRIDELANRSGLKTLEKKNLDDPHDNDESKLSETRIISFLTPIQMLFELRERLVHDQISFSPFDSETGISTIAKAIARTPKRRTKTVPAYQVCFLVNESITWVTTYFDEIRSFVTDLKETAKSCESRGLGFPYRKALAIRVREDASKYTSGAGSWWPIYPSYVSPKNWSDDVAGSRPSLRVVLFEFLATAAFVVIAAFSARRKEELDSLKHGCITVEDGEFWLETWISKNVKDLTKIPVPATVAKAVEVLTWLSEDGRKAANDDWLLSFDEMVKFARATDSVRPNYNVYRSLDRFSDFVGVPAIDGARWIPKPTEYRRFFGIIYFHRYRFPNLIALSDFYRHFNPSRTRGYITEIAQGTHVRRKEDARVRAARAGQGRDRKFGVDRFKDFEAAGLDFRMDLLADAVTGRGYLTGHGGQLIMSDLSKLVAELKSQLQLETGDDVPVPELNQMLRDFAMGLSLEPHPKGHSLCKCTLHPVDLFAAACVKKRIENYPDAPPADGPDLEFATDVNCATCAHNVQCPTTRTWWQKILEHEHHESSNALLPFLKEMARKRAAIADEMLARWHS